MTEEQRERYRKRREDMAIMAHSIAEQIVAMPGVSFCEALEVLGMAKNNIERSRDWAIPKAGSMRNPRRQARKTPTESAGNRL